MNVIYGKAHEQKLCDSAVKAPWGEFGKIKTNRWIVWSLIEATDTTGVYWGFYHITTIYIGVPVPKTTLYYQD